MRTKKKKQSSNKTLPLLIIAVLIGLMAYKYRLLDEKFLKGLPDIIPTEQTSALPSSAPADALEIPVMQSRTGGQLIKRKGYTLSYNADYKTPQWVAWELTGKETKGKEERTNKFLPDPDVRGAKAYSNDYTKSGYDRGHMAPAADMKWSKQAMAESFYMSNICPQNPNLNRGDWNDLEEKSRQWAKKYGAVYIACGPVYDHGKPKRIGNNKVAVPDAFYKVILINDSNALGVSALFVDGSWTWRIFFLPELAHHSACPFFYDLQNQACCPQNTLRSGDPRQKTSRMEKMPD